MWSDTDFVTSFDAEAGDIATLATAAQKVLWFNEGQARLGRYKPKVSDFTWSAAARDEALPADFVQMDKIVLDNGVTENRWRVFGSNLVIEDPDGAIAAGSARLYYWASWPAMVISGQDSELNLVGDYACLYYALSRFYRKLASNRAYYKRYSTLVGANAVSVADLQNEAAGYYQDYVDARDDLEPLPTAFFFSE